MFFFFILRVLYISTTCKGSSEYPSQLSDMGAGIYHSGHHPAWLFVYDNRYRDGLRGVSSFRGGEAFVMGAEIHLLLFCDGFQAVGPWDAVRRH